MQRRNASSEWALLGLAICVLYSSAPAAAQANNAANAETPQALGDIYACASRQNDADRLACYDAAVAHLRHAEQSGDIVAIDRNRATALQRESFGFSLPNLARLLPRLTNQNPALTRIDTQLSSITARANGYYVYRLANGQTWVDIEPASGLNPRPGDAVVVSQAAFGSYMMTSPRSGSRRVRRED
jgi:hypothetical protein